MIDLIEHISDPRSLLENIVDAMEKHGALIVYTANTRYWLWKISKSGYWYCSWPEHICFYSDKTFEYISNHSHTARGSISTYVMQLTKNIAFYLISLIGITRAVSKLNRGFPNFANATDLSMVVFQKQ